MTIKIGAACKWLNSDGSSFTLATFKQTTVKKLTSLSQSDRYLYLLPILLHNLDALDTQIKLVGKLPKNQRMWRLGSELLPVFTHPIAAEFYSDTDIQSVIAKRLFISGNLARKLGIRLSFHPGQFVVLGSQNPNVRESSLLELQYHCDVFTLMGYSGWHPDGLSVNVHVGVKNADVVSMRKIIKTSPKNLQNFLTLENDEFSWGASEIVKTFGDLVPIVLDVHHYWIFRERRLKPTAKLVSKIRDTWRGIQPKMHLSISRQELCGSDPKKHLSIKRLLQTTNKRDLRAHSLTAWNFASVEYAAKFGFDIMWEGKDKNLGAEKIVKILTDIKKV